MSSTIIKSGERVNMHKDDLNYSYSIHSMEYTPDILVIEDTNIGETSIEDDMESILKKIVSTEGIELDDTLIAYRDSDGHYNEVRVEDGHIAINYLKTSKLIDNRNEAILSLVKREFVEHGSSLLKNSIGDAACE